MKMTVLISLLLPSAHLVLSQTTLPTPSTHQAITSSSRPVPVELARRRKYPIAIRDMDSEVVVENAFFRFPPDMRLEDRSTVSGNTWQTTLAGLKKAPGYRGAYWGREMETPGAVQLLVEWSSKAEHIAFTQTPEYVAISPPVVALTVEFPHMNHVAFMLRPLAYALDRQPSPTTELMMFYLDPEATTQDLEAFSSAFDKFAKFIGKAKCHVATVSGWVVEDIAPPGEDAAKVGKAFLGAFVWETVGPQHTRLDERSMEVAGKMVELRKHVRALDVRHIMLHKS